MVQRTEQQKPCSWPPNTLATPLLRVSPRTSPGYATRAHPPHCVGVSAGLWADVVPVDVRVPSQQRSTQRQPTEGLVGAGNPGVDLTTGSTDPLGVDPFARRRNRVLHVATVPDQVSRDWVGAEAVGPGMEPCRGLQGPVALTENGEMSRG
jgi:hypothetical protein